MNNTYALVTGASKGIGRAIAECCAIKGMNLILVSLPGENLEEIACRIARVYCVKTHFVEIDLTADGAPSKLFNWCIEQDLQVNILVNNAGIGYQGIFDDYNTSFYGNLLKLNVVAPTLLIREFLPELRRHQTAHILNISSMGGFYPMPFKIVYAGSKSYITKISEALYQELKGTSVTVSVLCPAGVDSYNGSSVRIDQIGWIAKSGRLTPTQVAAIAVDGMLKKKRRIIPGRINLLFYYLSRLFPSKLQAKLIHFVLCKMHDREAVQMIVNYADNEMSLKE